MLFILCTNLKTFLGHYCDVILITVNNKWIICLSSSVLFQVHWSCLSSNSNHKISKWKPQAKQQAQQDILAGESWCYEYANDNYRAGATRAVMGRWYTAASRENNLDDGRPMIAEVAATMRTHMQNNTWHGQCAEKSRPAQQQPKVD